MSPAGPGVLFFVNHYQILSNTPYDRIPFSRLVTDVMGGLAVFENPVQ